MKSNWVYIWSPKWKITWSSLLSLDKNYRIWPLKSETFSFLPIKVQLLTSPKLVKDNTVFKGQVISKVNVGVLNSSKKETSNFCPCSLSRIWHMYIYLVRFLEECTFEIIWPLKLVWTILKFSSRLLHFCTVKSS